MYGNNCSRGGKQAWKTRKEKGNNSSRVKQLAEQLETLEVDFANRQEAVIKRQLEDRMTALRDLEKQLAASVYKGQLNEYREKAAREREELAAKMKLAVWIVDISTPPTEDDAGNR